MRRYLSLLLATQIVVGTLFQAPLYAATAVDIKTTEASIQPQLAELVKILEAERFYYYTVRQSERLHGKVDHSVIEGLKSIATLDGILAEFKGVSLNNPDTYDQLLLEALLKRNITVSAEQIRWDYPFFKRKLKEGFLLQVAKDKPLRSEVITGRPTSELKLPKLDPNLTLDGHLYTADRTTQAIFEFAQGKVLEFHLGPQIRFFEEVQRRGGKVIGEVSPMASNYNKAYIYKLPNETTVRVALTELYGNDRIDHLIKSAALILKDKSPAKIEVIGKMTVVQEQLAEQIKTVFKKAPRADEVVVGQKGAFGNAVNHAYKVDALMELDKAQPQLLESLLAKADAKKVRKILAEATTLESSFVALDEGSLVDKAFEASKPQLEKLGFKLTTKTYDFDIELGPFSIQDVEMQTKGGKSQRWRFISNVWGDEMNPMMRALGETGHRELTYIGTAGAFQPSQLKVGDVLAPTTAQGLDGKTYSFNTTSFKPSGITSGGTVTTVASIFDESHNWLKANEGKFSAVEVETAHLAEQAKIYQMRTDVFLLISDVVGTEETLAQSSSTKRKKSQLRLIQDLLIDRQVTTPQINVAPRVLPLTKSKSVNEKAAELLREKDPVFKMYAEAVIKAEGISDAAELETRLAELKPFTTDFLHRRLLEFGTPLSQLLNKMYAEGIMMDWVPDARFEKGSWNPKSDALKVLIAVSNDMQLAKAQKLLAAMSKDSVLAKGFLQVDFVKRSDAGLGKNPSLSLGRQLGSNILMNRYVQIALTQGGLVLRENASGSISFAGYTLAPPKESAPVGGAVFQCRQLLL